MARGVTMVLSTSTLHRFGRSSSEAGATGRGARDRRALVAARLMVAEGRVERETERAEVPITHLIVRRLVDRSDLLDGLGLVDGGGGGWAERALGRADEARRPEPGSQRPAKLPRSRDFR